MTSGQQPPLKVSVCLATFNGEAYVEEQVRSILNELGGSDELVIVDDASTDGTVDIVREVKDRRVRLIRNAANRGHVLTFERALREASGSRILLSDQDDVWLPGRLHTFVPLLAGSVPAVAATAFLSFPDSEGFLNDDEERLTALRNGGGLRDLTLLMVGRQPYFGCAMGMNRKAVELALPFPAYVEAHDHWIAIVGIASGGIRKSDEPTVARRLHSNNLTPTRRRSTAARLETRAVMARMYLEAKRRLKNAS